MKAYPNNTPKDSSDGEHLEHGMDLRDWFAGMALSGMMAHPNFYNTNSADIEGTAYEAYEMADAMMKQREVDQSQPGQ